MQRSVVDYADARNMMVDGQVRPNRVYDRRILDAMRQLPRERFVPPARAALAYADTDVPLPNGRMMLAPMTIARLVQLAAARPNDRVLVVGSGSGYGAALLAACGAQVTALEQDAALRDLAAVALAGLANIVQVVGPLSDGWPADAPYDVILIEGGAEEIPPVLARQLREAGVQPPPLADRPGRIVAVLTAGPHIGQAAIGERVGDRIRFQPAFDCTAKPLPGLAKTVGFVF